MGCDTGVRKSKKYRQTEGQGNPTERAEGIKV